MPRFMNAVMETCVMNRVSKTAVVTSGIRAVSEFEAKVVCERPLMLTIDIVVTPVYKAH